MKMLSKLKINPQRILQNDELIQLRGGYDGGSDNDCNVVCTPENASTSCVRVCTTCWNSPNWGYLCTH